MSETLKKCADAVRIIFAVVLFSTGVVNLKNFSSIISPWDITWSTFFEPIAWMIMMALGITIGAGWVKRLFRS